MKRAIALEEIKEMCDKYLYHIAIRASRGARGKNQVVTEYYKQAVIEVSKMKEIVSYPEDIKDMSVRIITPNNEFAYTRFGHFFFVGDSMYLISQDNKYAKFHSPEVHKCGSRLEVLDDSTTYTLPVLFAGIYTGVKDINDEPIFTGDIVKGGHNIAGVSVMWENFQHVYDNHSQRLSKIESFERITTVFYDLRRGEFEVDIWGRCVRHAQYMGLITERIEWIKSHQLYLDMPEDYTINEYINSEDNSARFALGYNNTNPLFVIGVNPSTADDTKADQTIRRVIGYAKRNGFNGFVMLNLYPQRATNPKDLHSEHDFNLDLHNQNLKHIETLIKGVSNPTILVAFGNTITTRKYLSRCFNDIVETISTYRVSLKTIGRLTQNGHGHPRHPSRGAYTELRDLCTQSYLYGLLND